MKQIKIPIFLIAVLLALSSTLFAQGDPGETTRKVVTQYNQAKDETEVEISQLPLAVDKSKLAYVGATWIFKGKKPTSPPSDIIFIVSVFTVGAKKYPDINQVSVMANGKSIGQIVMLNLDQRPFTEGEILETIGTRMKIDIFRKMLEQETVTFQMGDSTFRLSRETIAKFIEFNNSIKALTN
ncbi:MAG: hypothetical protein KA956_05860 [Pyrinomonadaceae bacterium]|nr:hypothetical protein [Acidobacteriota bacterium]MBK7935428.1 hypothetical protein [Acidobacteriota bacterium]MBP7375983.1 hypothetical protein [Pyrinomonadaceae bacterium]